jgi:hypothetical protein
MIAPEPTATSEQHAALVRVVAKRPLDSLLPGRFSERVC